MTPKTRASDVTSPTPCSTVEEGIQRYFPDLLRRARGLAVDRCEAEELVQETVVRALRFKHKYQSDTQARAWLMRVMFNLFVSQKRRRAVERRALESARVDPNGWANLRVEQPKMGMSRTVERAMGELPDKLAQVVELVDLFDFSYQEAASAQRIPMGTVMSRLHRARSRLSIKLQPSALQMTPSVQTVAA